MQQRVNGGANTRANLKNVRLDSQRHLRGITADRRLRGLATTL
jgi:hypothetical protein